MAVASDARSVLRLPNMAPAIFLRRIKRWNLDADGRPGNLAAERPAYTTGRENLGWDDKHRDSVPVCPFFQGDGFIPGIFVCGSKCFHGGFRNTQFYENLSIKLG